MPLPQTTLSLGPHTHPGESEHSKPKQAVLVRLSTETLDALQALGEKPPMEFEFGDTPGIHIGNTFYPMRPIKEGTPHELYLRTHSASKPNSPLKHYANVTGKFTIEHDKVGDNLKGKLREITIDAAKQRDDRRTKFIDTPPSLPAKSTKKRKEHPTSNMFRNAVRPSDQAMLNAAIQPPAVPVRVASPLPPTQKKKPTDPTLRKRLVHCIAIQERPRDQIVKLVAGADSDASMRLEVLSLLEEIGEPTSTTKKGDDAGSKTWRLKTEAWAEVRPFEWPKLPEQERINLARTGRQKLSSLGYSSSDSLWEHFIYRAPTSNNTSAGTSSGPHKANAVASSDIKQGTKSEVAPKRGVSSKEVKEKKARPKPDLNAEIQMKDEGARAASQPSGSSKKSRETDEAPQKASATARKLPGSGFKINKPSKPDPTDPLEGSNRTTGRSIDRDNNATRPSLHAKPVPPTPESSTKTKIYGSTMPTQRIRKLKESDNGVGSDSDREKGPDRLKALNKLGEERPTPDTASLKRRQADLIGNDSDTSALAIAPNKKRKVGSSTAVVAPSMKDIKAKHSALPKKPEASGAPLRQKLRKEPSPPHPALPKFDKKEHPASRSTGREGKMPPMEIHSSTQSQSRSSTESKSSGLKDKRRRASHIYTSSEDEGEVRKPRPLPTPPMTLPNTQNNIHGSNHLRPNITEPKPLPTDHASLRARYTSTYAEYMTVFVKMVEQKAKIDSLLRNGDTGSTTDSDGDAELLDTEDLTRLSVDYKRLHEELATIRGMFPESD